MSAANAAAKKRRANVGSSNQIESSTPLPSSSEKSKNGLTLPQVIALVDSRLTKLEESATQPKPSSTTDHVSEEALKPILQEYDHRFTMLATQINDLKEIVIKLQSYTMDVNKTLLEERIQFMNESSPDLLQSSGLETGSESLKLDDLKLEETEIVSSEISEKQTDIVVEDSSEKSTDM
jgi:N-methylhydantoinase A/oxoprolinase/acetone carboxylase beta subunit